MEKVEIQTRCKHCTFAILSDDELWCGHPDIGIGGIFKIEPGGEWPYACNPVEPDDFCSKGQPYVGP